MKYRITIELDVTEEGDSYAKYDEVYRQVLEDLDVPRLVKEINTDE